jgi:hypothetical protein
MERDWRDWRYWPDRPITVMRKVASWFQLTLTGWVALLVALVAMALATVGLLAVSHDVLDHGGLAQHDPSHLNFFIHLRSGWSVEVSRFVTQFGGAGVLVVLAVAAGGLLWWQGARAGPGARFCGCAGCRAQAADPPVTSTAPTAPGD